MHLMRQRKNASNKNVLMEIKAEAPSRIKEERKTLCDSPFGLLDLRKAAKSDKAIQDSSLNCVLSLLRVIARKDAGH